ncbi:MAG: hypothetical protein KAU36_09260 [candidate division Zixibacteria bacterium]|nr:hypothetical protein [candidate division Zixibacteria bacterium]
MVRISSRNEKIELKYLRRLREAEGLAESTAPCVEKAMCLYEDFTRHEDYAQFNQNKAVGLKKWLLEGNWIDQMYAPETI